MSSTANTTDSTGSSNSTTSLWPWTPEQIASFPHDNGGGRLIASIWVLLLLAAGFLGLRIYCKFLRRRGLWWDDLILIASWACITVTTCLLTYAVTLGYGYHIWDLPLDKYPNFLKMLKVINLAGTFSLVAAIWSKTSFALTLLRLTEGWMRAFVWFIIISSNIAMGLSALFIWVQCSPVERSWNIFVPGTCWPLHVLVDYDIFSAVYSAAMDITLALLPWKLVWGLQMRKKEKFGVAVAMSCGVFAGITALVKTSKIPAMRSMDNYDGIDLFIWGNAESCVTIVAASIPILRVLIRDVKSTSRRYYIANDEGYENGLKRSNTNTVVVSAQRQSRRESNSKRDDGSDRSILESGTDSWGIMRTKEIAVEFQDRSNAPFEMAHIRS